MWKDPIVEEVRKNRLIIEKENKGGFFFALYQKH